MWFDPAVVEAIRDAVPTWLGVVMVVLSYLGSIYLIAPSMIAAYWYRRDLVAPWLGGVIGCYGLMSVAKTYHTASRPTVGPPVSAEAFPGWFVPWYEHAAHISTTSFPSGHAMAATIIVGMIAIDLGGSRWKRALAAVAAISWVGVTRVGLGVHYPGDVVGGIGYGLAFLGLSYLARWYATDEATGAFVVGLVFGLAALAVSGSRNAHIAFGGAIGALVAWQYASRLTLYVRGSLWEYLGPAIGVVLVVATWFVTDLGIGNRVFIVGWSALFLAAVVLVPWLVPDRSRWPAPLGRTDQPDRADRQG